MEDFSLLQIGWGSVGHRLEAEVYAILCFAFVLGIELVLAGRRSTASLLMRLKRTDLWDLFSWVLYVTGGRSFLSNFFYLGALSYWNRWLHGNDWSLFGHWPFALKLFAAVVAFDFLFYWSHRLKHSSSWLWNAHEFHHSSTRVTAFTDFRTHPMDALLFFLTIALPIHFLFGAEPVFALALSLLTFVPSHFAHSRIDTAYGPLGHWLFVSPRYHHLHHSVGSESRKNFGNVFVIWDRMFGTYEAPVVPIDEIKQGIALGDEPGLMRAYIRPVIELYLYPFKQAFARLHFRKREPAPARLS